MRWNTGKIEEICTNSIVYWLVTKRFKWHAWQTKLNCRSFYDARREIVQAQWCPNWQSYSLFYTRSHRCNKSHGFFLFRPPTVPVITSQICLIRGTWRLRQDLAVRCIQNWWSGLSHTALYGQSLSSPESSATSSVLLSYETRKPRAQPQSF